MDLDDLPARARAILDAAAAADDPSTTDRERIDATFAATLRAYGIAAPPTGITPDTAAGGGAGAVKGGAAGYAAKIVMVIAGTGAVAAGLWQLWYGTPSRPSAPAAVLAAAPAISARPAAIAAHDASPIAAAPSAAAGRRTDPSTAAGLQAHDDAHRAALAARSRARTSPVRLAPPVTPSSSSAVQRASTTGVTAEDSLEAEMTLLKGANEAVRLGHYDRALRLLEAHAARFENGVLREERRGLQVLAMCGLGQTAVGLDERASFLVDFPRSVLTDKVRGACAQDHKHRDAARPGQP